MTQNATTLSIIPLADIEREITSRQRQQDEAARAQETLENELSDKRRRLEIIDVGLELEDGSATKEEKVALEKSISQINQHFQTIKTARGNNAKLLGRLSAYRAAIKCVERGLPKGILTVKEKTPAQS